MKVNVVKEWNKPDRDTRFIRKDKKNTFFYIVLLQKGRQRYLKIYLRYIRRHNTSN